MTDDRWEEIKTMVLDKFDVLEHRTTDLEEGLGTVEVLEFVSPIGKIRFERTDRPLVLGKKTIGSRRIGSETKVEYLYSDTERTHKFTVLRYDEKAGSWSEMEMDKGLFSF